VALVKKYGKVFACFDGMIPNLWITDVDMIKAMYVKDFDHFVDRRVRKKDQFLKLRYSFLCGILNTFF
jgi:hypothetical protein